MKWEKNQHGEQKWYGKQQRQQSPAHFVPSGQALLFDGQGWQSPAHFVPNGQALLFAVPLLCPMLIFLPLRIEFICIITYVTIMKNDVHGVAL